MIKAQGCHYTPTEFKTREASAWLQTLHPYGIIWMINEVDVLSNKWIVLKNDM